MMTVSPAATIPRSQTARTLDQVSCLRKQSNMQTVPAPSQRKTEHMISNLESLASPGLYLTRMGVAAWATDTVLAGKVWEAIWQQSTIAVDAALGHPDAAA